MGIELAGNDAIITLRHVPAAASFQLERSTDAARWEVVADKLAGEFSIEIIDPRTFSPLAIDTILKSLEKTGRLVVVDESWESRSTASEIAAQVVDVGFDLLDAPIRRVTIPNMPLPGGHMEPYVAPNPDAIEAAVRDVCR